ncbi:structural protein [Nocardia fluminea]|uniref:hypothetical protein n=1 Tax=Nocardia fluminea TaxID=134984 RepID=UPI00364E6591
MNRQDQAVADRMLALETEIEALVLASVTTWLTKVRGDVLPSLTAAAEEPAEEQGGVPPDVAALIVAGAVLWEAEVDGVFLPAFAGLLADIGRTELQTGSTRVEVDQFGAGETGSDQIGEWITQHTASVRDRLLGAPGAAVRAVQAAVDTAAPNVPAQRAAARHELTDPRSRTWRSFAARVARTEAAAGFNGIRNAAASVRDRARAAFDRLRNRSRTAAEEPRKVLAKRWVTQHDSRVRHSHEEADGQLVELGASFDVGGMALRFPGDPLGPPDETYGCRCFIVLDEVAQDQAAQVASAIPVGGTGMKTFRANIIPLGVFGRSQGWMLGSTVELVDTVLPQAFKWQKTADPGHEGAYTVAAIENLIIEDGWLVGLGTWLDTPEAAEAAAEVAAGVTRPSVELVGRTEVMTNAAGQPIPMETAEALSMDGEKIGFRIDVAEIVAATLVSVPEFRDASVTFTDAEPDHAAPELALVAAATVVEDTYDEAMFAKPDLGEPVPIHLTSDGRVQGYLATWDTEHIGHKDRPRPYHTHSGYAEFHQSSVLLASGDRLRVGRLTVGGGHAQAGAGMRAAVEHYDNVGTCWAFVRAYEDEIGIVVSGVLNAAADETMVRQALGTPHSGHWERVGGHPELIAACAVNTPGFPIRCRDRDGDLALVASFAPRWSNNTIDTRVLDDVAARAVRAFAEEQAANVRAAAARQMIGARRKQVLADVIRRNHAAREKVGA